MNFKKMINQFLRWLKPDSPCCEGAKMSNTDVHNPDRMGNGKNIYTCEKCGEDYVIL